MQAGLEGNDLAKFVAAKRAAMMVESGMAIGLGTGSTAYWLVKCLGERVRHEGLAIKCAVTSDRTKRQAADENLLVFDLDDLGQLDLVIDGADEIDPQFNLIKGAGGALLQEKIVASTAERMVVIADPSKIVDRLGAFKLPVEIVPFGMGSTRNKIADLLKHVDVRSTMIEMRMAGDALFRTDCGNHIVDLSLGYIANPRQLAVALNQIPGVIESGLFISLCDTVIIGYPDGHTDLREHGGPAESFFDESDR